MSEKAVPEGKYADIGGGLRIHYHDAGKGPVVLFLHGSGPGASGWSNFRRNYPFLVEHGYRTLVPDTLGFGYSSKPDDVDYGLDFLVDALRRFLSTVGVERCAVVGNSHGGAMSIRLATRFPELVSKLVLMAPGGLEERETYMKMEGIRAMMKAFLGPDGITDASMRTVFGHQLFDPSLVTDDIIRERSEIAVLQPKRVLTSLHVPHLAPELGQIQCPVLGFWGMDDKFCPVSGATTIARSCKRARVVLLSQCGHWVMVEHRDYFNRETLDFLREESLRGGVDDRVIEGLGDELYAALRERRTVPPITSRHEGVTIEDAYRISQRLLARRRADGERVIGKKIGVTSKPVQRMLDVHQPDFGWLTDRMQYAAGGEMPIGRELIQPRAEGELAFVLARGLRGPGVTPADVLAATAHVSVCFEIVDSRIDDWKIRIQDTIADNASSGLFLLGDDRVDPRKVDFYTCGMVVEKNGEIISTGAGAAALGSPLVCVAWLANTMGAFGIPLEAGEIILSGSLVPLEKVVPGDRMKVTVGGIGAADVTFVLPSFVTGRRGSPRHGRLACHETHVMKLNAAILGPGNIGTDLLYKALRSAWINPVWMVGVEPTSEGLSRARAKGLKATSEGLDGLLPHVKADGVAIAFDATSAYAHREHSRKLRELGVVMIDLTPSTLGPFCIPPVNLAEHLVTGETELSMVSCGGQATVPMVAAVSRVQPVAYGEIVATVASKSVGPGTRKNIDEFTRTTASAVEKVGGAKKGKAIIIINPAEPSLIMRDTIHCLTETTPDREAITRSIHDMVKEVQKYVPGYSLKNGPVFEDRRVSVFMEVTGLGDYLPTYAGNLDIMTAAALRTAEMIAESRGRK